MFIWAPCNVMCPAILIGWDPAIPSLPPHLDSYYDYEGAIGQQRQTISLCNPLKSNLKRSDSVAGRDDEVVVARLEPEVSVLVLRGAVSRQVEVAAEGVRGRLLVPQVSLNQHSTWNAGTVIRIRIYGPLERIRIWLDPLWSICKIENYVFFRRRSPNVRGVLGNKCAGHHNLKTVKIWEIRELK